MKSLLRVGILTSIFCVGAVVACAQTLPADMTAPPSDTTPTMPAGPSVSSVSVTDITDTSARVDIQSDELVQGYVEYGTTEQYGMSTPLTSEFSASPSFVLSPLMPETLYHYRVIVMDSAGNAAITTDETFTTLATPEPEPTPPPSDTSTTATTTTATSTQSTAPATPAAPALAITNTETATVSTSTARSTWQTNKTADGQVQYGITSSYGMFSGVGVSGTAHTISLSGLIPNTKYYYRAISKAASGETAYGTPQTFTTLKPASTSVQETPPATTTTTTATSTTASTTPITNTAPTATTTPASPVTTPSVPKTSVSTAPPAIGAGGLPVAPFRPLLLQVTPLDGKVVFSWKKDAGVKNGTIHTLIVKKEGSEYVKSRVDGVVVYDGTDQSFTDTNVVNGTQYHYALYSYGSFGRFSPAARFKVTPTAGTIQTARAPVPQPSVPVLPRDLYRGLSGDDVKHVQAYLAGHGFYPEGIINGYFGVLTKAALIRFQKLNNIAPASGYIGSLTREALGQ